MSRAQMVDLYIYNLGVTRARDTYFEDRCYTLGICVRCQIHPRYSVKRFCKGCRAESLRKKP